MEKKLKEVVISITNRCNSSCRMCQIPSFEPDGEVLTDRVKKFIREVSLFHPRSIVFSGGEPLLRRDILDLIALSKRCGFITCLASNGRLLDKRMAASLKRAGTSVVNISLDGPQELHDYLRGLGSFKLALRALKNLADENIEATVAMFVCRQNYRHMPYIVNVAKEVGATTVKFQGFNDIFLKDKEKSSEFLIPAGELSRVQESVREAVEEAKKHFIAINPIEYLNLLPYYLCGNSADIMRQANPVRACPNGAKRGCLTLWQSCSVDSGGHIYPCWIFSDRTIGNICEESIIDIWNSKRHQAQRRHIAAHGCPVCFLSCYDYNFTDEARERPSIKMRFFYLKKTGFGFAVTRMFLGFGRGLKRLMLAKKKSMQEQGYVATKKKEELAKLKESRELLEKKLQLL